MNPTNILIAYFSRPGQNYFGGQLADLKVGNTQVVAQVLQNLTGASLFRIETVEPYPLDYTQTTQVAQAELKQKARPRLKQTWEQSSDFQTLILGYPNWWGTMPMAVFSFLETLDLSGKAIAPVCTHEGSGLGRSEADIRLTCPQSRVLKGLALVGSHVNQADRAIATWLKEVGILLQ